MKKLLLTLPLLVYAVQIFAQHPTAESYLGLKGGVGPSINFVSDSSLDNYDIKYKLAFGGGIYYNISLGKKFSVQPELFFSQMGSELKSAQDENSAKLELSYFSMPFLIKFNPVDRLVFFWRPSTQLYHQCKTQL